MRFPHVFAFALFSYDAERTTLRRALRAAVASSALKQPFSVSRFLPIMLEGATAISISKEDFPQHRDAFQTAKNGNWILAYFQFSFSRLMQSLVCVDNL